MEDASRSVHSGLFGTLKVRDDVLVTGEATLPIK
jgi:hypothetical protein